jgi:predicted Fe-S protein YdhL (DUF1289 family)
MPAMDLLAERAREVAAAAPSEVPSPCVSVCRMDPVTQLCEGCLRTLDEIAAWGRMEDGEKRQVWSAISQRLHELGPKKGSA